MRAFRQGDTGDEIRDVQARLQSLGFPVEQAEIQAARFGPATDRAVRDFQQRRGLLADGLVGPSTWGALVEAGYSLGDRVLYLRSPHFRGDDVRALQQRLNPLGFDPGREDGILGEQTARAIKEFQRNVGLAPDGIVGTTTWEALERIQPRGGGIGRTGVRETEALREAGSLAGRLVALDAGHGPGDPGAVGPGGLIEAEATYALCERLAEELRERGAKPVLLREPGEDLPSEERVARAGESGADALISIHMGSHGDPAAEGASCYYFGREGSVSVAGRALAEMVQEHLIALGMKDGRTHPKTYPLLRETPMPAVHVEPCFITNPREERILSEGRLPHELAVAMAEALEGFFAGRAAEV
ncbi:MAG TPA: peptidoglycan-binding protein [Actinomycetota bacterium]